MTVRTYSADDIIKIRDLGAYSPEDRPQAIVNLAHEIGKPKECIQKRFEYEQKLGNVKQQIMKNNKANLSAPRYTKDEKAKIKALRDIPRGDSFWKAVDKLAKDLGRGSDAVYQLYTRLNRRKRRLTSTPVARTAHTETEHVVMPLTPRSTPKIDGKELRVSFSDIKIDMKTKEVIFIF